MLKLRCRIKVDVHFTRGFDSRLFIYTYITCGPLPGLVRHRIFGEEEYAVHAVQRYPKHCPLTLAFLL